MGSDKKSNDPLSKRQRAFVEQYLVDLNGTQAAIRAGYSRNGARAQGTRLLAIAAVAEAVSKAQQARSEATGISAERVLRELELLSFSDINHYVVTDSGRVSLARGAPAGAIRAISSVRHRVRTDEDGNVTRETELRLWDKPGPLKLAGRHVGLFPDYVDGLKVEKRARQLMQEALDVATREIEGRREATA